MPPIPLKKVIHALALGVLGTGLALPVMGLPQKPDTAELQKRYEEKLAKDWLKNAEWSLDLEDSLARAQKAGKPVFAYFTRSYSP